MKRLYKSILCLALVATTSLSFTSCMDETEPTDEATTKQIEQSSSAAQALLMAMPAYFNDASKFTSWIDDDGNHYPFGYGAIMYIRDLMTGDMTHNAKSYGSHFNSWAQNKYMGDGYRKIQYVWNYYYGFVQTANNMIEGVNEADATDTQLGYLGAGYAFRAMLYLDMARMYEFLPNDKTSSKNSDGNDVLNLTVPIVKAGMSQDDARNNPRVSRQKMAEFILGDLEQAEKYIVKLTDTKGQTLPNLACVYGLKARLYMWIEDYPNAQKYARLAINTSSVQPISQEAALNTTTGFNTASEFMWASQLTKEDYTVQTGIVNWVSWLSNQTSFGYTGVSTGLYNLVDARMYSRISNTDWRKLEFKAPDASTLASKVSYVDKNAAANFPTYTSVKFRPGSGNAKEYTIGAVVAYPIMRVEEMYFIEAEAAAHSAPETGKQLAVDFMKKYRDAKYSMSATTKDDIIEEIVFQKRVELWGEGQTFYDIKRLNYSVTRGYDGTDFYDVTRLNTTGRPAWMNLVTVRSESNNNKALVGWNNPDPSDVYTPWTGK